MPDGRSRANRKARGGGNSSSGAAAISNAEEEPAPSDDGSLHSSGDTHQHDSSASGVEQGDPLALCLEDTDVDPKVVAAFRLALRQEVDGIKKDIKSLSQRLDKISREFTSTITPLKTKVDSVEQGLQFASSRLDHIDNKVMPAVTKHSSNVSQRLLHETLKIDAHRRKWNVVVHGVDGPADEDESATRAAVINFATTALKLSPEVVKDSTFSACHRLSKKANAGIIIRFVDLAYRDKWLAGARNLQEYLAGLPPPADPNTKPKKISLAIDLPPKIRPLKDNLMMKRKQLPMERRKKSKLRYLTQWPFVELRVEGQDPIRPSETLSEIASSILGVDLMPQLPKFEKG